MKRFLFLAVMIFFSAGSVFSFDFGLLIDQRVRAERAIGAAGNSFSYTPGFTPWFSWDGGQGLSLYCSGIFSFEYNRYGDNRDGSEGWNRPVLFPEISRFALRWRSGHDLVFEAGRMFYADTTGFAASGLFDGFRLEADLPSGSIAAGLWYTGLLYKETTEIIMTSADARHYAELWDLYHPGAYFASRRALASFRWDMPLGEFNALSLEILAQFDLNGDDEALHSQYGELQAEFFPAPKLGVTAGVLFEIMEHGDGTCTAALGMLARLKTDVPGSLDDGLALAVQFSSGQWNDTFTVFTPLSSPAQGMIFPKPLSGLALLSADYTVRLPQYLFLDSAVRYFIRTYNGERNAAGAEGYRYGAELWASLAWQPLDDLRLSLGGGLFFPGLGNIYPADNGAAWNITAALALSL
jgi:hypothetical protein